MKFGDNLKRIRKKTKITQEDLAEKVGVSRQSVSTLSPLTVSSPKCIGSIVKTFGKLFCVEPKMSSANDCRK